MRDSISALKASAFASTSGLENLLVDLVYFAILNSMLGLLVYTDSLATSRSAARSTLDLRTASTFVFAP
jgi:hypothetical protein